MSRKLSATKGRAKEVPSPDEETAASDAEALHNFCSSFEHEDIPVTEWKKANRSLDLTIPIYLTKMEVQEGGTKEITFSRMTNRRSHAREIIHYTFRWSANTKDGFTVTVPGLGDLGNGSVGQVNFIIRISTKNQK